MEFSWPTSSTEQHSTFWKSEWTVSYLHVRLQRFPAMLPSSPAGARRKPHSSPAQSVGGPGSVHGGGPGRISGRAAPHHAGGRAAQTAQQWQLLRGCAAIQAGATDGPSQHGEEGIEGWVGGGRLEGIMNGGREGVTGMHPVIAGSALTPFFLNTGEIPTSQILVVFLHTLFNGKN